MSQWKSSRGTAVFSPVAQCQNSIRKNKLTKIISIKLENVVHLQNTLDSIKTINFELVIWFLLQKDRIK